MGIKKKSSSESIVREIKRKTKRKYSERRSGSFWKSCGVSRASRIFGVEKAFILASTTT